MAYHAQVLVDAMKAKRMSDADLAQAAGIDRTTAFRIRTGRVIPTLPVARRIADALGIDIARFIPREGT